ncbi:hypothetical protein AN416_21680 [Paraburkholderia caribensis]|nr:hypothetical protein AN416_21680 [Paraburkholderia caribensis]AUT53637.1 hypothetical protein C2L66_16810 [Paraburkholderia caribensis]
MIQDICDSRALFFDSVRALCHQSLKDVHRSLERLERVDVLQSHLPCIIVSGYHDIVTLLYHCNMLVRTCRWMSY